MATPFVAAAWLLNLSTFWPLAEEGVVPWLRVGANGKLPSLHSSTSGNSLEQGVKAPNLVQRALTRLGWAAGATEPVGPVAEAGGSTRLLEPRAGRVQVTDDEAGRACQQPINR